MKNKNQETKGKIKPRRGNSLYHTIPMLHLMYNSSYITIGDHSNYVKLNYSISPNHTMVHPYETGQGPHVAAGHSLCTAQSKVQCQCPLPCHLCSSVGSAFDSCRSLSRHALARKHTICLMLAQGDPPDPA